MKDRSATGGDCVNIHHRCAHPHPGDQRLKRAFIFAVVMGNVGRRTAHVKPDNLVEPGHMGRLSGPDDTAGGTGQNRILTLEEPGIGKPAIGLHEHQPGITGLFRDQIDIAPENGRHVSIHNGGITAPDKFHQRADFVRYGNLREADITRYLTDHCFMIVIAITVHKADCD